MLLARTQVTTELLLLCLLVAPCFVDGCPSFVDHPNDTPITLSSDTNYRRQIILYCETSSLDQDDQYIAWLKDGVQISDGDYEIIPNVFALPVGDRYDLLTVAENNKRVPLYIKDITPCTAEFDSGNYSCILMSTSTNCSVSSDPAQVTVNVNGSNENYSQCPIHTTVNSAPTPTDTTTAEGMSSMSTSIKTENRLDSASSSVPVTSALGKTSTFSQIVSLTATLATNISSIHSLQQTKVSTDSTPLTIQTTNEDSSSVAPLQTSRLPDLNTNTGEPSSGSEFPSEGIVGIFENKAFFAVTVAGSGVLLLAIALLITVICLCRGRSRQKNVEIRTEMRTAAGNAYYGEDIEHREIDLNHYDHIETGANGSAIESEDNLMMAQTTVDADRQQGDNIADLYTKPQKQKKREGSETNGQMDDRKQNLESTAAAPYDVVNVTSREEEAFIRTVHRADDSDNQQNNVNNGGLDNSCQNVRNEGNITKVGNQVHAYEIVVLSELWDATNIVDGHATAKNEEVGEKSHSSTDHVSPSHEKSCENVTNIDRGPQTAGDRVTEDERTAPTENAEGLTYADLDLSIVEPRYREEDKPVAGTGIVYADLIL